MLRGKCVVCGEFLTESDYDSQSVVAAIGPEGTVVCCVMHLADGPETKGYKQAVSRMAVEKAKQLVAYDA